MKGLKPRSTSQREYALVVLTGLRCITQYSYFHMHPFACKFHHFCSFTSEQYPISLFIFFIHSLLTGIQGSSIPPEWISRCLCSSTQRPLVIYLEKQEIHFQVVELSFLFLISSLRISYVFCPYSLLPQLFPDPSCPYPPNFVSNCCLSPTKSHLCYP